jgi:hypothetical protein
VSSTLTKDQRELMFADKARQHAVADGLAKTNPVAAWEYRDGISRRAYMNASARLISNGENIGEATAGTQSVRDAEGQG